MPVGPPCHARIRHDHAQCPKTHETVSPDYSIIVLLCHYNVVSQCSGFLLMEIRGGKLVLWEVTQDVFRAGFSFGILPGWWLGML